ncbi:MAG: AAA family ATPase [Muribaculaceae bacterium]|nr:AAA family ATPase [Muribaculaceae bacterium]
MQHLRYPIGIQTFSKIIEDDWIYVDKTGFIPALLRSQYLFLSRPRRFGKSLLLSTLEAYFEGRRDLFKGLALDNMDIDWTPSPVLHFDFNSGVYENPEGVVSRLSATLDAMEKNFGLEIGRAERNELPLRFERVITRAYESSGRQVAILVDEFDKPLLGLEDNPEVFESNQRMLKSFLGNLKSMDRYIRFAFITGVARFSKVSIFSDINQLKDISLDDEFADICGWTEEELTGTFRAGIEQLALKRKESYSEPIHMLRNYYDGYRFTAHGSRLYNPFSVLKALDALSIEPYWFESATPYFLYRLIVNNSIDPADIHERMYTKRDLMRIRLGSRDPVLLMFQTGHLTIDSYDEDLDSYTLRFPNKEVALTFLKGYSNFNATKS